MAQAAKNLPAVQETWAPSLGWEDPLEEEMATHSIILAWRIPWTEEPDRLQSMGPQRFEPLNLSFPNTVLYQLFSNLTPPSPVSLVARWLQRGTQRVFPRALLQQLGSGRVQARTQLHLTAAHCLPPNQLPRQLAFLKPNLVSYLGALSLF